MKEALVACMLVCVVGLCRGEEDFASKSENAIQKTRVSVKTALPQTMAAPKDILIPPPSRPAVVRPDDMRHLKELAKKVFAAAAQGNQWMGRAEAWAYKDATGSTYFVADRNNAVIYDHVLMVRAKTDKDKAVAMVSIELDYVCLRSDGSMCDPDGTKNKRLALALYYWTKVQPDQLVFTPGSVVRAIAEREGRLDK